MKNRLAMLTMALMLTATIAPAIQAYDLDMTKGFKMKTTKNRETKVTVDVTIDEDSSAGSLSMGFSNDVTEIIHWCKPRRRRDCPSKLLDF